MAKMIVEFEWDENDLGPLWMNLDNLRLLLYNSDHCTREDLLQIKLLSHSDKDYEIHEQLRHSNEPITWVR